MGLLGLRVSNGGKFDINKDRWQRGITGFDCPAKKGPKLVLRLEPKDLAGSLRDRTGLALF